MIRTIALALALPALAADAPPAVQPEPGAGFEVVRYELALTPDLAAKAVAGVQTTVIRSTQDGLRMLTFSPNTLTIDRATVDGRPVRVRSEKKVLTFALPAAMAKGRSATLRIAYHGTPARGVIFRPGSVYTSYFACDWMVCLQDAPGDKALFALDLRLPTGLTSLAAGERLGAPRAADATEVHRWRTPRPYPAYLYGFAAGAFARVTERHKGAQLHYLSDIATGPELRPLFAETRAMVDFLSDKAGLALPAGQYTQLLVPGREAQEAATYSVIGKGELDRSVGDPQKDWAIVHELAHQWWGNLVTCATWGDFWLNEGVAVFMTAAWKEHRFGRRAYDAELDVARQRLARAREAGWDKPLAFAGDYPSIGQRRAVQYSKGALFMDHLRTTLGDATFWAGVKAYTRRHAGGSVTSKDFQRAMETASGRNLSAVFEEWVYGPLSWRGA